MTLAPRFLINLWAGYRVSRFVRHLKSIGRGVNAQQQAFKRLMGQYTKTEFGRHYGLTATTSYAQFRETVPPQLYDTFQPAIARMAAGVSDVICPGRCLFFVETAGSSGDKPKLLPVPEAMLRHYRRGLSDALFLYAARVRHAGVFLGRHLHTGASTALIEEKGTYRTSLDGMLTLCLTPWVDANLHSPPPSVANLPEGPEKTLATAKCMIGRDVTLVAGTPASVYALSLAAREAASTGKRRMTTLQAMWPNLECFMHFGAPLGLYAEVMRGTLGPTVNFHEVYGAAEGIFAAQDDGNITALRLLTDAGIFFEFLPLRNFSEDTLANAGALCLPLEKVQPGIDYVLVVTTPAGLCRYVPGDIVRFLAVEPPRLVFAGRTRLQLNAFGERVTERELFETLITVCHANGWQAVNFHVAPFHYRLAAGQTVSSHEWWLELRTHTVKTPTANVLGPELDAELVRRNSDYAAKRAANTLELPSIRLVMPGVFEQWAQSQSKSATGSKMPSCRSDRFIADQLAQFARFHQSLPTPTNPATPRSTTNPARSTEPGLR